MSLLNALTTYKEHETPKRLLLVLSGNDASYMQGMKHCYAYFTSVHSTNQYFATASHFHIYCKNLGITHVATTRINTKLFVRPVQGTAQDNWGYIWANQGIRCIVIPPLEQLYSVAHMRWLMEMYMRKLIHPEQYVAKDVFTYHKLHESEAPVWLALFSKALFIAVDIETSRFGQLITSCSYTAMLPGFRTKTCVIAPDYTDPMPFIRMLRAFNALPVPKVMQNGQYDTSYFMRFGAPITAYLWDTYNLQHCMYSELPATLAFMSGLYLQNFEFWKEERTSGDLYQYNAKDTHNTAWLWLAMIHHMNLYAPYARGNYITEFPLIFPCITVGLEGIAVDEDKRKELRAAEVVKQAAALHKLHTWVGEPWNPASPDQTLRLMKGIGYTKATASDKKTLQAFAESHPLCDLLKIEIVAYRKASKAISQYYDMELLGQRLLYQQDPAGTDTGRLASKASNFWVGTQIQNIPAYCKGMFITDHGYLFAEVDNSQSESRCTAYISQDENLIRTVETSPDFHCTNASLFFGMPFEELFDVEKLKVLRKDIRTVAKRINHGANYNMGAQVLWETMGTRECIAAGRLLGLPHNWSILQICKYLLMCFDRAYPDIKGRWYKEVKHEVATTGRLVGATGWTRRTFLRPADSKPALNSCVAHPPQSLSVMLVNQAFYEVWQMQFFGKYAGKFRIKAQIHDSIFFQYLEGYEEIVQEVSRIMYSKNCVIHGRTMNIPNDPKGGGRYWGDLKE